MPDETPTRRVLVSANPGELLEHTNLVLERLHSESIEAEALASGPDASLAQLCRRASTADALVVLLGRRSPWVPEEEDGGDGEKSVTVWEVEAAREAGVPVFAFVREPESSEEAGEDGGTPAGNRKRASYLAELDRVLQGPRLEALSLWLAEQTAAPPKRFRTPQEAAAGVEAALSHYWAPRAAPPAPAEESAVPAAEPAPAPLSGASGSASLAQPSAPAPAVAPEGVPTARFPLWAGILIAALIAALGLALLR